MAGARGGDIIYRLDEHGEETLFALCDEWAREEPFLLVAEGLEAGSRVFPADADPQRLAFTLIADPIDGTRGLMYGKRSAWALMGIAPPPRAGTWPTPADITLALQAELPTPRAALADRLWAVAGQGAQGETRDLRTAATPPPHAAPQRRDDTRGRLRLDGEVLPRHQDADGGAGGGALRGVARPTAH